MQETLWKREGVNSQEYILETAEMAEWIKHEPFKYEDQGSSFQNPCKHQADITAKYNPNSHEADMGFPGASSISDLWF